MSMPEKKNRLVSLGRWLFRYRSITALPVITACILYLEWSASIGSGQSTPDSRNLALARSLLALLLLLLGCLLRLRVAAVAPPGTSGRGRKLEARVLVTWGIYAHTRNPLYLGNFLICFGLLLEIGSLLLAALALTFFFAQYIAVIRAEEDFLYRTHGNAYLEWSSRVPRFWPRLRAIGSQTPSSRDTSPQLTKPSPNWRRAIRQEVDTCFAALGGWTLWRLWSGQAFVGCFGRPSIALAVLCLVYLGVKADKKRARLRAAERARLRAVERR